MPAYYSKAGFDLAASGYTRDCSIFELVHSHLNVEAFEDTLTIPIGPNCCFVRSVAALDCYFLLFMSLLTFP